MGLGTIDFESQGRVQFLGRAVVRNDRQMDLLQSDSFPGPISSSISRFPMLRPLASGATYMAKTFPLYRILGDSSRLNVTMPAKDPPS